MLQDQDIENCCNNNRLETQKKKKVWRPVEYVEKENWDSITNFPSNFFHLVHMKTKKYEISRSVSIICSTFHKQQETTYDMILNTFSLQVFFQNIKQVLCMKKK